MRPYTVFVSYSHKDEPPPEARGERWATYVLGFLEPTLEALGAKLFIDKTLGIGALFGPEIAAELAACDLFVLLASTASLSSAAVREEIAAIEARIARARRLPSRRSCWSRRRARCWRG